MRVASSLSLLAVAIAFVLALAGCPGNDGNGSSCNDYSPPAGFDATQPAVSFSKEVMPIFGQSCAFSTCHGSTVGNANGVFLGKDAPRVYAAIVGVKGDEHEAMPFVTAGNPRESYLMRKMDGSQCALDAQCSGGSCQGSMPKNEEPLDLATRDKIRRWISQGAKND
jgi:hypothetical protein